VRLRVTRRAATQLERALAYIEAESPQGANLPAGLRAQFINKPAALAGMPQKVDTIFQG